MQRRLRARDVRAVGKKGCPMRRSFFAFAIACLCMPIVAHAVTYYVRVAGSDTNNGLSAATAFRTVQRAMQAAQAGDTVYIGAGTYTEQLTTVRSGTSATVNIRFIGDTTGAQTGNRGTPTITFAGGPILTVNHNWNHFQSIRFDGGTDTIRWNATAGGTLSSVTVRNGTDDGVEFAANSRATISGGTFERARDCNLVFGDNTVVTATGSRVRTTQTGGGAGALIDGVGASITFNRTRFLTNNTQGVLMRRGTVRFTNCILADNRLGGVRVEGANTNSGGTISTATTVQIVNCTFDDNLAAPAVFWRDATGVMINNIFSYHTTGVDVSLHSQRPPPTASQTSTTTSTSVTPPTFPASRTARPTSLSIPGTPTAVGTTSPRPPPVAAPTVVRPPTVSRRSTSAIARDRAAACTTSARMK
jgi:hypothetical protein